MTEITEQPADIGSGSADPERAHREQDVPVIAMIVCHFDDTNPIGGLEKQTKLLSQELRRRGKNVVILSSTRKMERARWSSDDGVDVRLFWTYASPQISGRYLPAALLWALQLLIWVVLNRRRIALIHCHQIRIHAFVAAFASKLFAIPSVLKSATGGSGADIVAIGSRKYFGDRGRRFLTRHASRFIATTNSIGDDLQQHQVNPEKIVVIPNGVVPASATTAPAPTPPDRFRRCLFLGRLASDKNPLPLAEAATVMMTRLGMSLDIYGEGDQRDALVRLLVQRPERGVAYLGHVDEPASILPSYGWLILPSDAEGLSNAMIEAMMQGVVPLATRVSGCIDHIVPGRTGYFLEGVDTGSIAGGIEAIARVGKDQWTEMSERVKAYAAATFTMEAVGARYEALYRDLT